jgi:hypothetical protein
MGLPQIAIRPIIVVLCIATILGLEVLTLNLGNQRQSRFLLPTLHVHLLSRPLDITTSTVNATRQSIPD